MKQDDGLRSWLKQADDLGELRTIDGADWDLEIGGVADIVTEREARLPCYSIRSRIIRKVIGSCQFAGLDQAARFELGNATGP